MMAGAVVVALALWQVYDEISWDEGEAAAGRLN